MDRVRITGTIVVTPFVLAGAAFGIWGLIDRLVHWKALTQGRLLNEAEVASQMLVGAAAIALVVTLTASLWLRCFSRRRAWKDDAEALANPFSTSGKYAVWRFQRPSRRQALLGALQFKKKVRKQSRSHLLGRPPREAQRLAPTLEVARDRDDRQVQNTVGKAVDGP